MRGHILSLPLGGTDFPKLECEPTGEDIQDQLAERPVMRARAARGAVTGMLLGAGMWAGIIVALTAVLKH